jgi:amino acid transporter
MTITKEPPPEVRGASPRGVSLNIVLRRSLGRFDLAMIAIAAVISIDTIGTVAAGGGTAFLAMLALVVLFLVPYGMLFAELTSSFTEEGGPYMWVRLAFGRLTGAIAVFFYWVTNPIWLGGTLAALAAATFSGFLFDIEGNTSAAWLVQAVFIWAAIAVAIISLRRGKHVIAVGAVAKLVLVLVFTVTTVVYAVENGAERLEPGFFSPTLAGFLAVAPILLFACRRP